MKEHPRKNRAGFTLIEYIIGLVIASILATMLYNFFGSMMTQSGMPIIRLQKANNLSGVMEKIVSDYERLHTLDLRYIWKASTAYRVNSIVTPLNNIPNPPDGGYYYKCTTAGTSGTIEPTNWPTSTGDTITDGTVVWKAISNIVWQKSISGHPKSYAVNDIVLPITNTGHYYRCTSSGTSGTTEPTNWPRAAGATVTEPGGPTWTEAGTILDTGVTTDNLWYYLHTAPSPVRYGTGYTVVTAETKFIQFNGSTEVDAGAGGTSSEKNNLKVTIRNEDSAETLTAIFTIR